MAWAHVSSCTPGVHREVAVPRFGLFRLVGISTQWRRRACFYKKASIPSSVDVPFRAAASLKAAISTDVAKPPPVLSKIDTDEAFLRLHSRLTSAVDAENQVERAELGKLYDSSSLQRLKEEGLVLTWLTAEWNKRLYSQIVWTLSLHPAAPKQQQQDNNSPAGANGDYLSDEGVGHNFRIRRKVSNASAGALPELPFHKFQRGDSVLITWRRLRGRRGRRPWTAASSGVDSGEEEWGAEPVEATVLEVKRTHLLVTLSKDSSDTLEDDLDDAAVVRLDKGERRSTTTRRQKDALYKLFVLSQSKTKSRDADLVLSVVVRGLALNALESPAWAKKGGQDSWLSRAVRIVGRMPTLNWSQREAIVESLSRTLSLWQGPPGTGKTLTLQHFIKVVCTVERKQYAVKHKAGTDKRGKPKDSLQIGPILAVAETNTACDNLVEGLVAKGVHVVRFGAPAKVREELRSMCVDALVESSEEGRKAAELRDKSTALMAEMKRGGRRGMSRREQEDIRAQADEYWKQAEIVSAEVTQNVLKKAEVIAATCVGCGDRRLRHWTFKMVIIDEASQATEPSTLIPLLKGAECVVLAGDIKQLPPTIKSKEALEFGLDIPLLTRLQTETKVPSRLLQMQYRMHPDIAHFSSNHFYNGLVLAGVSTQERPLIKGVPWPGGVPVVFLHCPGREATATVGIEAAPGAEEEKWSEQGHSYQNYKEAWRAVQLLQIVLAADPDVCSIAILTPYNGQVRLLKRLLRPVMRGRPPGLEVTVSTVDGYQGREADLIIFSTVRSNREGRIGFVSDARRLNVAITRARRGLIVLGNGNTLRHDPNWRAWLQWLGNRLLQPAAVPTPEALAAT